jgi:hypothetical protein
VKVATIDQCDIDRKAGEVQGRLKPAEPATQDDDSASVPDVRRRFPATSVRSGSIVPAGTISAAAADLGKQRFDGFNEPTVSVHGCQKTVRAAILKW